MTDYKCKICGNDNKNNGYQVREMMFGSKDVFNYFECSECSCLQIAEIPSNISKYYPNEYYSFSPQFNSTSPKTVKAKIIQQLNNNRNTYAVLNKGLIGKVLFNKYPDDRFRSLSKITNLTRNSKILDVGCGSGYLLNGLKQIGFNNLLGIDKYINQDIEYENKLKIKKGTLEELNEKWDVIMFHHSFEHMPEPLETLQAASNLLNKGGTCIINLPTTSSYAWKHYRQNWVQLDAPRHFFLHSTKSLQILGNKANLSLKEVVYNSVAFQFWGSEQYLKDIPLKSNNSYSKNRSNSIFTKKQIKDFEQQACELNRRNQGDSAAFYFKKEANQNNLNLVI
jgi:2-polyprenyl-3-methyl-5-hydroxy-6-metoxy-1,4-benzoquinol methylase